MYQKIYFATNFTGEKKIHGVASNSKHFIKLYWKVAKVSIVTSIAELCLQMSRNSKCKVKILRSD